MPKFKLIVSEPKTGKAKSIELDEEKSKSLIDRQIGEAIDGSIFGVKGRVKITGGSDKDGIPMRSDIHGSGKKHIILSGGTGFNPKKDGERKRKVVRGKMIVEDTYQINMTILQKEDTMGKKERGKAPEPKPSKEETKTEEEKQVISQDNQKEND